MADGANLGREVIRLFLGNGWPKSGAQIFDRELVGAPPPTPLSENRRSPGWSQRHGPRRRVSPRRRGVLPVKYAIVG